MVSNLSIYFYQLLVAAWYCKKDYEDQSTFLRKQSSDQIIMSAIYIGKENGSPNVIYCNPRMMDAFEGMKTFMFSRTN